MFIILFQSGGVLLWQQVNLSMHKRYMKQKLMHTNTGLETLYLSFDEYVNSQVNENELFINGNLYDIKGIRVVGNTLEVLAKNDTHEHQLMRNLEKSYSLIDNKDDQYANTVIQVFHLNYVTPESASIVVPTQEFIATPFPYFFHLIEPSLEISSPPPRV